MNKPAQFRKYFEARLDGARFTSRAENKVRCCFHNDSGPSLQINLEKGVWKCFAGCGEGGIVDFEMKWSNCDRDTARANVAAVVGENLFSQGPKPEAVYRYLDAMGRLLFEKVRYPGKHFQVRRPDAKGGWIYRLEAGAAQPLYRLPELVRANFVFICEGEKDCDRMRGLNLSKTERDWFVAATTNFAGAGKWRDADAVFFAGKQVVILRDNDAVGRVHGLQVATSVHHFAAGVKVVDLPGLPEKGDVSDYLDAHSAEELLAEIRKTPSWTPDSAGAPKTLVPVPSFIVNTGGDEICWLVEGVLERGANGVICAEPKVGKSYAAADLALSLALGTEWLGFRVPRAIKVALISREDNPPLTAWRLRHLFAAKDCADPNLLERNLWINTRAQSKQLLLDNPEQLAEIVADLRIVRPEFLIFDVLNRLHLKDENDSNEMRQVLAKVDEIQREIGCSIALVHHFNKTGAGSLTQRMRGSSAIGGWAEWLMGIELEADSRVRKMCFELKAACGPSPVYWTIASDPGLVKLKAIPAPSESAGQVQ